MIQKCVLDGNLAIFVDGDIAHLSICCFCVTFPIDKENIFKVKSLDELSEKYIFSSEKTERGKMACGVECKRNPIKQLTLAGIRACNLNCYHCFHEGKHYDEKGTLEFYFRMLEFFSKMNLETIYLDGSGEIFLYWKKLKPFLEGLNTNNFKKIVLQTNATIINQSIINDILKLKEKTGIEYEFIVSLDGITKKTFEKIRKGAKFETVINNIILLSKYFYVKITFTVKDPNYMEAFEVKDYLKGLGLKNFDVGYGFDAYDEKAQKYSQFLHHSC